MAMCFGSVMQHGGGVVQAVLVSGLLFLAAATWGGWAHNDYTLVIKGVKKSFFGDDVCGTVMQHGGGVVQAVLVGGLLFLAAATWGGWAHNDYTLVIKGVWNPFFGDDVCGTTTLPALTKMLNSVKDGPYIPGRESFESRQVQSEALCIGKISFEMAAFLEENRRCVGNTAVIWKTSSLCTRFPTAWN